MRRKGVNRKAEGIGSKLGKETLRRQGRPIGKPKGTWDPEVIRLRTEKAQETKKRRKNNPKP